MPSPAGVWAAPGRVNLIGEHTDYNQGWVLPFGLARQVVVTASQHRQPRLLVTSAQRPEEHTAVDLVSLAPGRVSGWAAYPAGVAWVLVRAGHRIGGARLCFDSDLPVGAGLASSAALACATALSLCHLNDLALTPGQMADVARAAENDFVGVPCGAMDPTVAMLAEAGRALLIDTRSNVVESLPLAPVASAAVLMVINTNAGHALVGGDYAERRHACRLAADRLGVAALRDLGVDDLDAGARRLGDRTLTRRVRHVVTENARVLAAARCLRTGDLSGLGPLLTASHASLRDDFEVSSPRLDAAVAAALAAGAFGARLTGAGFGGCAIVLAPAGATADIAAAVADSFARQGFSPPTCFPVEASAGARRID